MEEVKIGFFRRVKMAIFNLEDYKIFANEKFPKAFKFLLRLIAIITLILALSTTIRLRMELNKLSSYVKNEFPDFSYSDGVLNVVSNVEAYDKEYKSKLVVDTADEVSSNQLEEYKEKAKEGLYSFILLKNTIYCYASGYEYKLDYSDVFGKLGINSINKEELINNYLNDNSIFYVTVVIFIYSIIVLFVTNFLTLLEDILIIAIFGWLASKICKVALKFSNVYKIAVYSVTLSLILSAIYSIVNTYLGFEIKYFSLMYMIISYIYIVAAILIIKTDDNIQTMQEIPIKMNNKKEEEPIIEKEEKPSNDNNDKKPEDKEKEKKEEGSNAGAEA